MSNFGRHVWTSCESRANWKSTRTFVNSITNMIQRKSHFPETAIKSQQSKTGYTHPRVHRIRFSDDVNPGKIWEFSSANDRYCTPLWENTNYLTKRKQHVSLTLDSICGCVCIYIHMYEYVCVCTIICTISHKDMAYLMDIITILKLEERNGKPDLVLTEIDNVPV